MPQPRRFKSSALPSQKNFLQLATRFRGFSGPVGSGKTLALADQAIKLAHANPGRTGLLGAPTYPMLRDATLKAVMDRLDEHKIRYDMNRSEMRMSLFTGMGTSTILFRPVENFDRLRGQNLAWFGLDELSYCPEYAWMQLEARLRDPKARELCGFAVWTPHGFDFVYRRFISNERQADYEAILALPFENTHLPKGFYQNLQRSYNPLFAKQEVFGEYLNVFSGRAYQQFDRKLNVWPLPVAIDVNANGLKRRGIPFQPCRLTRGRPILWALDFNINPATSIIAQTIPFNPQHRMAFTDVPTYGPARSKDTQLNVFDEMFLTDTNTYQVCEEFLARMERILAGESQGTKLHVIIYGDATGTKRSSSATKTDWQIIREFFDRHKDKFTYAMRVKSANPLVKDRVNAVNAMCCNAVGVRRLLVHEKCSELIRDLEQVAWKKSAAGVLTPELDQKTDPMRTHISDALGYLIEKEFGQYPQPGERAGVIV